MPMDEEAQTFEFKHQEEFSGYKTEMLNDKIKQLESENESLQDKCDTLEQINGRLLDTLDTQTQMLSSYELKMEKILSSIDEVKQLNAERFEQFKNILFTVIEPALLKLHADTADAINAVQNKNHQEMMGALNQLVPEDSRDFYYDKLITIYGRTEQLMKHVLVVKAEINKAKDTVVSEVHSARWAVGRDIDNAKESNFKWKS